MPLHTHQNVIILKKQKITSVGKDVEKLELLCIVGETIKWGTLVVPQKQ